MRAVARAPEKLPDQVALAKAIAHPLRFRLLQHYCQEETSPSRLAEALGVPLGDASYHTRVLRDLGCIELVRTEPRRGAREHFYRGRVRPIIDDGQAAATPAQTRRAILSGLLSDIWEDLGAAAEAGVLDRPDVHVSRTALQLDAQGWAELSHLMKGLVDEAVRIEADSARRLEADPAGARLLSELALLHFARASPRGRAAR